MSRRTTIGGALAGALVLGTLVVPMVANATTTTAFTAGDVVVYRVGDGSTSLSDNAAPVFLDEYASTGTLVRSIALPASDSGSTHELTASGSATSEGQITLSADGRYLMAPGYHKSVGTDSVASTDDVTIARVGADGAVNTTTMLDEFADDNNVRGTASTDGTHIWVSGANGGIGYTTLGSGTFTRLTDENVREVQIAGGQLYVSSDKDDVGISRVGAGTPTTSGQKLANLPGSPESSGDPYGYVLLNLSGGATPDTLYAADSSAGKINKFSLVGGAWKAEGSKSVSHVVGLTGLVDGGRAVLYATSSGSSGTSGTLYTLTDPSGAAAAMSGSATTLATAGSKKAFRGVALAPSTGGAPSPSASPSASATPTGSPSPSTSPGPSTSPSTNPLTPVAWPGSSSIANADGSNVFGEDLSGLYQEGDYQNGGVMWGAQNSGTLWRLVPNGSGGWKPDTANGWASGKTLRYPGGSGTPDDEGVTLTGSGSAGGVFVASERNGDASDSSRLSVLRYDVSGTGTTLTATKEWNLTSDLPSVGSNLGFEGITWVPDSYLTSAGFRDASTGAAYNPNGYGAHGGGVFFLGVEGTGMVYGYVLQDSGAFTRIASISSGMAGVMELQWEPQASRLWIVCDDTCNGQHRTMQVNASGAFATTAVYNRPSGMPNYNNEGFSVAGGGECVSGSKPVYWADDSDDGGHAVRKGSITC
ncbi:hypothetical protein [Rugosimonospora acidiphila]